MTVFLGSFFFKFKRTFKTLSVGLDNQFTSTLY